MKRILCCLVYIIVLASVSGCNTDNATTSLLSGCYYAVGDYEEMLTPYIWIDTNKNEFSMSVGAIVSYAEHGKYEIVDGKILATSQSTIFEFEIKDKNTLVLIDDGDNDYFKIPINTQFIFSKDLK